MVVAILLLLFFANAQYSFRLSFYSVMLELVINVAT